MLWTSSFLFIGLCLLLPLTGAQAQDDDAHLAYRQKLMQSIGTNKAAIDDIVKNDLPYPQNIAAHARILQESGMLIESAFKKKIVEGRTDSQPAIWQEWDQYAAAAAKFTQASGALAKAAASGDDNAVKTAMRALGGSCGGCHKTYRKPRAERFKRDK